MTEAPNPALLVARPTPSFRALLSLAWPIVISRSTQTVIGLSDAVLVAPLGKDALAATTTGGFNTFLLLILPMGTVFIVSSFSSQLFGKGDLVGARRYGFYGLAVAGATQLLCMASIGLMPWVLAKLPYDPAVRALMIDYLAVRLLSGGAAMGIEALANYYGGLGKTWLPMLASVTAMVLNVIGNWLLITGHLGFPAMGVTGSALASAVSTTVAFVGLLVVFLVGGRKVGVLPKLHAREFWRMLRFGLPSGINWFFEFLAFSFFVNVVMAGLGTVALAAMMSVLQINSVSFMPAFGLASAGAILVGQAIGAGAQDEVPRVVKLTVRTTIGWQGVVALFYLLLPGLLFAPFAQGADREALLLVGARMLMLSAGWQVFDGMVNTYAEAMRAAGDTTVPLVLRLTVAWLVFVPGSYISVRVLGGASGVAMVWLVLYMGLLALSMVWRFRSGAWRRVQLVEPTV